MMDAFGSVTEAENSAVAAVTSGICFLVNVINPPYGEDPQLPVKATQGGYTYPNIGLRVCLQCELGHNSLQS